MAPITNMLACIPHVGELTHMKAKSNMSDLNNVTARVFGDDGKTVVRTINVPMAFPTSIDALVKAYGKEVCAKHVIASFTIAAQSYMRSLGARKPRLSDAEIIKNMREWKPGLSTRKPANPVKTMSNMVKQAQRLTASDRDKLMAMLTGRVNVDQALATLAAQSSNVPTKRGNVAKAKRNVKRGK